jgi:NADH-quinone oxidoreductase subunit G
MNVVDICPVGALTSRDFRFKARVWYLERTASVCAGCANGCNIDIYHREGRLFRFQPRANPDVNGFWMCDAGRLSVHGLQGDDRLGVPLVRGDGAFVAVDWDRATTTAADRLRRVTAAHGRGSIAVVVSAESSNEEIAAAMELGQVLDGDVIGVAWSPPDATGDAMLIKADKNPNSRGLRDRGLAADHDGLDGLVGAMEAGRVRALVAFRADVTRWTTHARVRAALERLDCVIVIDSVQRDVAQFADVVLPIATYAESEGTFTNYAGRVQRFERAVPATGESRPGVRVLADCGGWVSAANARASA